MLWFFIVAALASGVFYSFPQWEEVLPKMFPSVGGTEISTIYSFALMGQQFSLIPGVIFDQFSPSHTLLYSAILAVLGAISASIQVMSKPTSFSTNGFACSMFLLCQGSTSLFMTALCLATEYYKKSGKLGLVAAAYGASGAVYTFAFNRLLGRSLPMILLIAGLAVVSCCCVMWTQLGFPQLQIVKKLVDYLRGARPAHEYIPMSTIDRIESDSSPLGSSGGQPASPMERGEGGITRRNLTEQAQGQATESQTGQTGQTGQGQSAPSMTDVSPMHGSDSSGGQASEHKWVWDFIERLGHKLTSFVPDFSAWSIFVTAMCLCQGVSKALFVANSMLLSDGSTPAEVLVYSASISNSLGRLTIPTVIQFLPKYPLLSSSAVLICCLVLYVSSTPHLPVLVGVCSFAYGSNAVAAAIEAASESYANSMTRGNSVVDRIKASPDPNPAALGLPPQSDSPGKKKDTSTSAVAQAAHAMTEHAPGIGGRIGTASVAVLPVALLFGNLLGREYDAVVTKSPASHISGSSTCGFAAISCVLSLGLHSVYYFTRVGRRPLSTNRDQSLDETELSHLRTTSA